MLENLEGRLFLSADVEAGILTVTGTSGRDSIVITQRGSRITVREGRSVTRFNTKTDPITSIAVNALGGNDKIVILSKLNAAVDGGDGNDWIIGGLGNDVLVGGNGKDKILGLRGNDSITGGAGRDILFGGSGDDTIDAFDTERDQVAGGRGTDKARVDENVDQAWSVEEYLAIETNSEGLVTSFSGTIRLGGAVNAGAGQMTINTGSLSMSNPTHLTLIGAPGIPVVVSSNGINQPLINPDGATLTVDSNVSVGSSVTLSAGTINFAYGSGGISIVDAGAYMTKSGAGTLVLRAATDTNGDGVITSDDYHIISGDSGILILSAPATDETPVEEPADYIIVEPAPSEETPPATE
jgi:hypothetical protein